MSFRVAGLRVSRVFFAFESEFGPSTVRVYLILEVTSFMQRMIWETATAAWERSAIIGPCKKVAFEHDIPESVRSLSARGQKLVRL